MKFTNIFLTVMLCTSFGYIFASSAGGGASKNAGSPTKTFLLAGKTPFTKNFKKWLLRFDTNDEKIKGFIYILRSANSGTLENNSFNKDTLRKLSVEYQKQFKGKSIYSALVARPQTAAARMNFNKAPSANAMIRIRRIGDPAPIDPMQALKDRQERQAAAVAEARARLAKENEKLTPFKSEK